MPENHLHHDRSLGVWCSIAVVFNLAHEEIAKNCVAHELAQMAKRMNHYAIWRDPFSSCVDQLVAQDCEFFFPHLALFDVKIAILVLSEEKRQKWHHRLVGRRYVPLSTHPPYGIVTTVCPSCGSRKNGQVHAKEVEQCSALFMCFFQARQGGG